MNTEETVIEIEENNETVEEITEEENDGEDIVHRSFDHVGCADY